MRVVNRKEFLEMPPGTLYRKFEPVVFDELSVKLETLKTNDWVYIDLTEPDTYDEFSEFYFNRSQDGEPFRIDYEVSSRDGFYDDEQLFIVYDQEDLKQLIRFLWKLLDDN